MLVTAAILLGCLAASSAALPLADPQQFSAVDEEGSSYVTVYPPTEPQPTPFQEPYYPTTSTYSDRGWIPPPGSTVAPWESSLTQFYEPTQSVYDPSPVYIPTPTPTFGGGWGPTTPGGYSGTYTPKGFNPDYEASLTQYYTTTSEYNWVPAISPTNGGQWDQSYGGFGPAITPTGYNNGWGEPSYAPTPTRQPYNTANPWASNPGWNEPAPSSISFPAGWGSNPRPSPTNPYLNTAWNDPVPAPTGWGRQSPTSYGQSLPASWLPSPTASWGQPSNNGWGGQSQNGRGGQGGRSGRGGLGGSGGQNGWGQQVGAIGGDNAPATTCRRNFNGRGC